MVFLTDWDYSYVRIEVVRFYELDVDEGLVVVYQRIIDRSEKMKLVIVELGLAYSGQQGSLEVTVVDDLSKETLH